MLRGNALAIVFEGDFSPVGIQSNVCFDEGLFDKGILIGDGVGNKIVEDNQQAFAIGIKGHITFDRKAAVEALVVFEVFYVFVGFLQDLLKVDKVL